MIAGPPPSNLPKLLLICFYLGLNYLRPLRSACAREDIREEFSQDLEAIH
jgi:hypothetical protein